MSFSVQAFTWLSISFCLLCFFCRLHSAARFQAITYTACTSARAETENLKLHFTGLLWMGIVPLLLYNSILELPCEADGIFRLSRGSWWVVLPCMACSIAGYQKAKKKKSESLKHILLKTREYIPLRVFFIIAYEFFFRGVLLFESLRLFSLVPAIALNTALYFIVHIYSSRVELFGTLLLGPLLCLAGYYTGSVTGAILIHLSLTLSYEIPLLLQSEKQLKRIS